MKALMHVIPRHTPQEPLGLKVVAFDDAIRNDVKRGECEHIQIVAVDLDVVDPSVRRKPQQFLPGSKFSVPRRLVDEKRLASANK
jgi:hypothetical protein